MHQTDQTRGCGGSLERFNAPIWLIIVFIQLLDGVSFLSIHEAWCTIWGLIGETSIPLTPSLLLPSSQFDLQKRQITDKGQDKGHEMSNLLTYSTQRKVQFAWAAVTQMCFPTDGLCRHGGRVENSPASWASLEAMFHNEGYNLWFQPIIWTVGGGAGGIISSNTETVFPLLSRGSDTDVPPRGKRWSHSFIYCLLKTLVCCYTWQGISNVSSWGVSEHYSLWLQTLRLEAWGNC